MSEPKKAVATDLAPAAIGPYSQALVCGGLVFASGQIPLDPATGRMVDGGIAEQARQALRNLAAVLQAAGSGMDQVLKCSVFLKDLEDFAALNEVYAEHFSAPYPARAAVEVSRLPKDALVEIEAVARVAAT